MSKTCDKGSDEAFLPAHSKQVAYAGGPYLEDLLGQKWTHIQNIQ